MTTELPTLYQQFIYKSRYSRWLEEEKRREDWIETVHRYLNFMYEHLSSNYSYSISSELNAELFEAITQLEIMPSMRCLMTAGPALERCNIAGYNCSYLPIDHTRAFDECLYILMCGTGVGFSVERNFVDKLPLVNEHFEDSDTIIIVQDTKAGWARALRELISLLYVGQVPKWDLSKLRPKGARLKVFGGTSSGPEPLRDLLNFCVSIFKGAAGRHLTPLECHDIMCMIGDCVVSGGVRRSALISLSNVDDLEMRKAKSGSWWNTTPYRALSNNSAVYKRKPEPEIFLREWLSLVESKSGERGIFNRDAAIRQVRRNGRRIENFPFGTNPCSEIILRPNQFCNLTEVVCRRDDDLASLTRKVKLSTILGTFQSSLTDFKYLRKVWKKNTEEERLLGVSLTGIMDNNILAGNNVSFKLKPIPLDILLNTLKEEAVRTNEEFAKKIGINQSTAVTCVKPSGTVSQLVNSASGIHCRHSDYYIRSVRGSTDDPVTKFLQDNGIPWEDELGKEGKSIVFYFHHSSPKGSKTRKEVSALEHLELWKQYQEHWCEHKPSITVSVKDDEWPMIGGWVYDNFDIVSGIAFLPHSDDDHNFKQAPYKECTKEEYKEILKSMPKSLDWSKLKDYENEDNTASSQTLACIGGVCEIVDIGSN